MITDINPITLIVVVVKYATIVESVMFVHPNP